MSQLIVYCNTASQHGEVYGYATTYATARDNAYGTETYSQIGQEYNSPYYMCSETFYGFDTSGLPDTCTIDSVAFAAYYGWGYWYDTAVDLNVYAYDFGTSIDTADYRTMAQLQALTKLAHINTNNLASGYCDFTIDNATAFAAAINKTGYTRLLLASSDQVAGNAPASYMEGGFNFAANQYPRLTINYTATTQAKHNLTMMKCGTA